MARQRVWSAVIAGATPYNLGAAARSETTELRMAMAINTRGRGDTAANRFTPTRVLVPIDPGDVRTDVPMLVVQGTADGTISYEGGSTPVINKAYPGARQTVSTWSQYDGCDPTATFTVEAA